MRYLAIVTGTVTAVVALATNIESINAQSKKPARRQTGAFRSIKDVPNLPRVLLIGDSISIGYTLPTREVLKGMANVHRIPTNGGDTQRGLDSLDQWLGDGKWDVIHFNWGLHDLKFIDDKQPVPIEKYEKNLSQLVGRLKKTGARLIWCSTPPVPDGCTPPRKNEDVIAYNAVAAKIMKANGVAIDDLYTFVLPQMKKIQRPQNVHFLPEGYEALAGKVAESIKQALADR